MQCVARYAPFGAAVGGECARVQPDFVLDPAGAPPNQRGLSGQGLDFSISFGGIFASLEPLSTTWPRYDYYDPNTETTTTILGSEFSYRGTQFGGIFWELLSTFGFGS